MHDDQVVPKPHRGSKELVALSRGAVAAAKASKKKGSTSLAAPIEFIFQHRKYAWNRQVGAFHQLRPDCRGPLSSYAKALRYGGDDGKKLLQIARRDFGLNELDVHVPTFRELLLDRLRSPMTVMRMVDMLLLLGEGFPFLAFQTMAWTLWSWYTSVRTSLAHIKRVRKEVVRGLETAGEVLSYRCGSWVTVPVRNLVPGDVIALPAGMKEAPVDCLVLHGGAVVDEAILTGESLPQLKRPLGPKSTEASALDMEGQHRPHVLFSGTSIMRIDKSAEPWPDNLPTLPQNTSSMEQLVGVVLRTGYYSSQGELLRMIDLRSGKVQSDSPEAMYILAAMSVFSFGCAVGVACQGLSVARSPSTILVQCIRILSSGIPFYLMDDFSDTVARGVEELATKAHVVCTEPYRIPLAGRVDTCLFDKTGTLTTEHLFLQGVVPPSSSPAPSADSKIAYHPTQEAPLHAQMVLGACHSLVEVNNQLAGDTLELSALEGVEWAFNSTANIARSKKPGGPSLIIVKRHDFSAALQRMSVLVKLEDGQELALVKGSPESIWPLLQTKASGGGLGVGMGIWPLLQSSSHGGSIPAVDKAWYDATYQSMASDGTRVIALAWKQVPKGSQSDRDSLEKNLVFAGFAGFRTRIRADSAESVVHLHRAGVETAVVSGDSLLTSLHVAREVGIVRDGKSSLRLSGKDLKKSLKSGALKAASRRSSSREVAVLDFWGEEGQKKRLAWVSEDGKRRLAGFAGRKVGRVAEKYELCTSGKALAAALKGSPEMAQYLHFVRVFARMTPALKETVVRHMKAHGHRTVLMCGDGANDVGALKQADVGVALLTGFGAANADEKDHQQASGKESSSQLLRSRADVAKEKSEAFKKEFMAILQENQAQNMTGAFREKEVECEMLICVL